MCNFGRHSPAIIPSSQLPGLCLVPLVSSNDTQIGKSYEEQGNIIGNRIIVILSLVAKCILESALTYSDTSCYVIYALDPFVNFSGTKKILECLTSIESQTVGCPNANVVYQLVPIHHIVQRDDLLLTLKELSFSVYLKSRRIILGSGGGLSSNTKVQNVCIESIH